MKFTRFNVEGSTVYKGIIAEDTVKEIKGDIFGDWEYTGEAFSRSKVKLLAPLEPNQIIGIGANYVTNTADLPSELPEIPVFFFKPTSSVIGPDEEIVIPEGIDQVKFESELAIVIGKEAKNFLNQMFWIMCLVILLEMMSQHLSFSIKMGTGQSVNRLTPLRP